MNDFTAVHIHFTPDLVTCKTNINEDIKRLLDVGNATSLKEELFVFDMLKEGFLPAQEMEIKTFTLSEPSRIMKALRVMPFNT